MAPHSSPVRRLVLCAIGVLALAVLAFFVEHIVEGEFLIRRLSSPDEAERREAAIELDRLRSQRAVFQLLERLRSSAVGRQNAWAGVR